jgi:molecular chaperone GrpE
LVDEKTAGDEKADVEKLNHELKERKDEVERLKSKLESLEKPENGEPHDAAQKFIEGEKKRSEDYLTRLKYLQADFENYRKRVEREMHEVEDFSTSLLIKRLLPVLDGLDLAIASGGSDEKVKGILEGLVMVRKNLASALQSEGLREIDAVGKPFDPSLHEAVERVDGGKGDTDTVIAEIRKGYILKNRVLRPTMVKVESAPKSNGE